VLIRSILRSWRSFRGLGGNSSASIWGRCLGTAQSRRSWAADDGPFSDCRCGQHGQVPGYSRRNAFA